MEPRIARREAFAVMGVLARGNPSQLDYHDLWTNQVMPREPEIRPLSVDGAYYEAFFCSGTPDDVEVIAGMSVPAEASVPEGLEKREVPAATFAVFDCTLATVGPTWGGVEGWLAQSEYEYDADGKADFECYPPNTEGPESPVQIWVPVRVKQ